MHDSLTGFAYAGRVKMCGSNTKIWKPIEGQGYMISFSLCLSSFKKTKNVSIVWCAAKKAVQPNSAAILDICHAALTIPSFQTDQH